ncbi:uncharacterized protein LOC125472728 [Pyrus x bretschneideri]|uniref:uncharacterized protein LOC125472728 n=1 Tax=Pyrus x bretschneideri TaxID=225117 RepID=UPI00202F59CD|nr:uncharacterized protein LOC125472728 [Pyrus x bretschneideri]
MATMFRWSGEHPQYSGMELCTLELNHYGLVENGVYKGGKDHGDHFHQTNGPNPFTGIGKPRGCGITKGKGKQGTQKAVSTEKRDLIIHCKRKGSRDIIITATYLRKKNNENHAGDKNWA